jgi:two-component system, NtrC family, sensor kinase
LVAPVTTTETASELFALSFRRKSATMGQKVNILMVDDQPGKLLTYEAILGELGENLVKASSGREALDLLLKMDIAVVLMDVSMPELNGFELADMIRQHPRFQQIAIIFISAVHLTDLDRLKGYQRGAMDYISVPVVPELLRAKVSVFAELHRKARELELLNRELEQRVFKRTAELRESENQLRQRADLLDLASEAIMVHDSDGVLRFWNSGAEAFYGWTREEVLGRNIHQILRTKVPSSAEEIEAAITREGRWEGNLVQVTKNGGEVVVASRQVLQIDGRGARHAILEINRDITAQLQAEEALRKSEKLAAMGRVAGIIAHEINNPLDTLRNAFYLLRDHPSLDDNAREYTRIAEEELSRVAHITRQTLSFYRESKEAVPVLISGILDDILTLQMRLLERNGIVLEKQFRSDGLVFGLPGELKQVFLNLIGNAIQAMPEGGRLRVQVSEAVDTRQQREGVRVLITDTGSGIRPEDSKQLFEPFFTTKSTKGTGLGLWISKGIVEKYQGVIRFRSIRLSSGNITAFSVFIPKSASSQMAEPQLVSSVS